MMKCNGIAVKRQSIIQLISFAGVFERTCAHCQTRDAHKRLCMYSLGWEDMGVVITLEEWTLVVGLADNAGVALAGAVKVVVPGGQIE